jgi:hypothetical protein
LAAFSRRFDIPDLNLELASLVVLLKIDVDREMGVDVSHLVLISLGDANDHVVDQRPDGSKSSDVLPCAMVQLDVDDALRGVRKGHCEMTEVLGELACSIVRFSSLSHSVVMGAVSKKTRTSRTFHCDNTGLDYDLDLFGNVQGLLRVDVLHPGGIEGVVVEKMSGVIDARAYEFRIVDEGGSERFSAAEIR